MDCPVSATLGRCLAEVLQQQHLQDMQCVLHFGWQNLMWARLLGCKVEKLQRKLVRLGQESDQTIRALEATASTLTAEKERLVSDQDWAGNIIGSLRVRARSLA